MVRIGKATDLPSKNRRELSDVQFDIEQPDVTEFNRIGRPKENQLFWKKNVDAANFVI